MEKPAADNYRHDDPHRQAELVNQLKVLWGGLRECERCLLATCSEGTENWYEAKELLELDKRENQVAALDPSMKLSLSAVQIEIQDEGATWIQGS